MARKLRRADTWAEQLLWRWLRDRRFAAYKFRLQHPLGPHVLDFYRMEAKLDIELDGSLHGHTEHQGSDAVRDAWLAERGIRVLRIWNARLRRETDLVRDTIWQTLQERAPKPMPEYCRAGPVQAERREQAGPSS